MQLYPVCSCLFHLKIKSMSEKEIKWVKKERERDRFHYLFLSISFVLLFCLQMFTANYNKCLYIIIQTLTLFKSYPYLCFYAIRYHKYAYLLCATVLGNFYKSEDISWFYESWESYIYHATSPWKLCYIFIARINVAAGVLLSLLGTGQY